MQLDCEVPDIPEDDDPPISDVPPDVIHSMVSQLPTGYRMVFNLYVFENKSHREIASLLGIKEKSSASQLCRAKNLLAKMIRQYNDK
jgi:RNA polymerase sigma-70 factor (ECF subfamily)